MQSLRDAGLSLRAIASATGYSEPTVRRTLAPASNDAPEWVDAETGEVIEPDEPVLTEAECEAIEEARTGEKITGLDGKRYAPSKSAPTPSAPPRKPITDEFRGLALDLDRITGRVIKLAADDRFKKNADQISQSYLHDLIRARRLGHGGGGLRTSLRRVARYWSMSSLSDGGVSSKRLVAR